MLSLLPNSKHLSNKPSVISARVFPDEARLRISATHSSFDTTSHTPSQHNTRNSSVGSRERTVHNKAHGHVRERNYGSDQNKNSGTSEDIGIIHAT